MIKNLTGSLLGMIVMMGMLFACTPATKPEEQDAALIIKPELAETLTIAHLTAEVTDTRTTKKTEYPLADPMNGEIKLPAGTYDVTLRGESTDRRLLLGQKQGIVLKNTSLTVTIPLEIKLKAVEGLIFGDIFNNGETNGNMMHPDQYFTIVNNSAEVQYVDGLIFAVSAHPNSLPQDQFTQYSDKTNEIPLLSLIQFPGNGRDYPVQPGGEIVVAATAINHYDPDTHPNSVDLSGVDFEMVFPDTELSKDIDNPLVPNMIIHYDGFLGTGIMHPRGFFPPVLFALDTDINTFKAAHSATFENAEGNKVSLYTVPTKLILDAVETGCEGQLKQKALPASLDEGAALVTGCHRQELLRRKSKMENGREIWEDTNNSSNDFERIKGQNAYPQK